MRDWSGERAWPSESRDGTELEERVSSWLARQQPASWIVSTIVLGSAFIAMVLFAVIR